MPTVEKWQQDYAPAMPDCPDSSVPGIYEKDGVQYPMCHATGVFYAPPFSLAALAELLWPDVWGPVPPI